MLKMFVEHYSRYYEQRENKYDLSIREDHPLEHKTTIVPLDDGMRIFQFHFAFLNFTINILSFWHVTNAELLFLSKVAMFRYFLQF